MGIRQTEKRAMLDASSSTEYQPTGAAGWQVCTSLGRADPSQARWKVPPLCSGGPGACQGSSSPLWRQPGRSTASSLPSPPRSRHSAPGTGGRSGSPGRSGVAPWCSTVGTHHTAPPWRATEQRGGLESLEFGNLVTVGPGSVPTCRGAERRRDASHSPAQGCGGGGGRGCTAGSKLGDVLSVRAPGAQLHGKTPAGNGLWLADGLGTGQSAAPGCAPQSRACETAH